MCWFYQQLYTSADAAMNARGHMLGSVRHNVTSPIINHRLHVI